MLLAGTGICMAVADMVCVIVAGMGGMIVSELACGEGGNEYGKADEHAYAFPCEASGLLDSAFGLARSGSVGRCHARSDSVGRCLARSDSVRICLAVMLMPACVFM